MNADPFGVPGRDSRAEPPCTVGAAALPPSGSVSGKADIGLVTKVNPFYNGQNPREPEYGERELGVDTKKEQLLQQAHNPAIGGDSGTMLPKHKCGS